MAVPPDKLASALRHHGAGRLDEAERLYAEIAAAEPENAQAWHLLGVAAHQRGDHPKAIELIRRAIGFLPGDASFFSNLGLALHAQRQFDDAVAAYRQALALKPDYADALYNLGNALQLTQQPEEAAVCYRRAVAVAPDFVEAHNNLGNVLRDTGWLDEAVESYRRALALKPGLAALHNNLGNALKAQRRLAEAIGSYREALRLHPNFPDALNNLGNVLQELEQVDEAVALYRRALVLRPDFAEAHNNLGNALQELGKLEEAVAAFERALALDPAHAKAQFNLALTLQEQNRPVEAADAYTRALSIRPDYADARARLINLRLQMCDWPGLTAELAALKPQFSGRNAGDIDPFLLISIPGVSAREHLQVAKAYARQRFGAFADRRLTLAPRPEATSKLRIGYLSADFHTHATSHLLAETIELHDQSRFEIVGYSLGPDDRSPMRQRVKAAFDRFHDFRKLSFEDAAARIRDEQIDILVDLKGYTGSARPEILALRPAPIQVSFLGYPSTMGADFIDYLIADPVVCPPAQADAYSERLAYLPDCYQPNDRMRRIADRVPSRAECSLPEGGLVFCSFNANYKITPDLFGLWMDLLREVPGSVLWLLEGHPATVANLRREASARGILAERLVFAPKLPIPEHLARHALADLFLDTLPYGAHTTASDALWAGLPVLTCAGDTFAGRVGASLVRAAGLPELAVASFDDYRRVALRLAAHRDELTELRLRLNRNRLSCALFDSPRFTRNLEALYTAMWRHRATGQPPAALGPLATAAQPNPS
jgi:predicted O-linked N-acetylglucosamine transferase (SPINDLY family)